MKRASHTRMGGRSHLGAALYPILAEWAVVGKTVTCFWRGERTRTCGCKITSAPANAALAPLLGGKKTENVTLPCDVSVPFIQNSFGAEAMTAGFQLQV